jgi:hypothetical protein
MGPESVGIGDRRNVSVYEVANLRFHVQLACRLVDGGTRQRVWDLRKPATKTFDPYQECGVQGLTDNRPFATTTSQKPRLSAKILLTFSLLRASVM